MKRIRGSRCKAKTGEKAQFYISFDTIEPVPNGEFSGDVLYSAFGTDVQAGGAILREFKCIKNWSVLHDAGRSGEGT
ncbi:hypothetical protein [Nitrosomonas sp. Is79A3]|uniref:hypothetical protein n=1 Tax=Nitrosomonas sp. (strain Is79A3) TaxID=261292 RepID=UPI0003101BAD